MLRTVRNALASPVTGPIATAAALAFAVTLGVAQASWTAREARYEARIAQLAQLAERERAGLRTQLATCQSTMSAAQAAAVATARPAGDGARRLLEQEPEGIDACARMESADRAVLSNLRR